MDFLSDLWMPILISGVAVFVVSSILHMAIPIHKNDVKKMENEDAVLEAMRSASVAPGAYMFPGCHDMKETGTEEYKAKVAKGPVGWLTVYPPGGFNMGKSLGLWFVYTLVVSFFAGYIAHLALQPGADYMQAFRVVGAVAFMAYGVGSIPESIWKGQSWVVTGKFVFDGLLYALATAGVFGWLWPSMDAAANGAIPNVGG